MLQLLEHIIRLRQSSSLLSLEGEENHTFPLVTLPSDPVTQMHCSYNKVHEKKKKEREREREREACSYINSIINVYNIRTHYPCNKDHHQAKQKITHSHNYLS